MMRLFSAGIVFFIVWQGTVSHAADQSLSNSMSDAFETVIIDAGKAASKATAAAKDALSAEPKKKKRSKNVKKDAAEKDDADQGAKKSDKPAEEKGTPTQSDAKTPKPESAEGKDGGKDPKSGKGSDPDPAKAADGAKPADPKSDKPAEAAKKPVIATEWPAAEVELAKARCTQLLKGVDAVTIPEAPFRKGDCGSKAPVRLISIGKNPEISFSPPPVVSCDLVIGLTKWLKNDVQPAAKKHLGSEVIRIESMSDYSCRMAYGRVGNKLSEHGKANALDIGRFITRKGEQAVVLSHWGQTKRDVAKQIAAAKAAAAKAAAASAAAEKASAERAETAELTAKSETTGTKLPKKTLIEGMPGKKDMAVPASVTRDAPIDATGSVAAGEKKGRKNRKDAASKQGKSKKSETVAALPPADGTGEAVAPAPKTPTSRFLHEVHASGCRIFGTTLGPEANEAHRNHFHVDMAERKFKKICD